MGVQDDWGNDPSVQKMRRIFARMEESQSDLLERLKLSPLDERLRRVRESARNLFEQVWPQAQRTGMTQNEDDAANLYLHCFVKMLNAERIKVPTDLFPSDDKILRFLGKESR